MSGLPRSGSTLLTKLLSQHTDIFASSTSPLLDYVIPAVEQLYKLKRDHSAGHYIHVQKILTASAFAFYDTEKTHIIDKNRAWLSNYESINTDLKQDPKVILTLRPVEEVVASFYKLINHTNNGTETPEQIFINRIAEIYQEIISKAYLKDKLYITTYKQITENTHSTLHEIEKYIGVDTATYDINNIVDITPEDDSKWGIPHLHDIRATISNESLDPESILTKSELTFCRQLTAELYNAYGINA